jgi:hypothetical protein
MVLNSSPIKTEEPARLHAPAPDYSDLFFRRLLDRRRHLRDRHQGASDLIQQLICIFFLCQ